jgi:phosphatidylglycerol:prolipoprotein diacylglycerol transferase
MSSGLLYGVFVAAGILVAFLIRRAESLRLGYAAAPGYGSVGAGCLMGGALGSKLGMLLYIPAADLHKLAAAAGGFDFSGKTILGALAGGYLGGEIAKKLAGVRFSTGDALAVAIPAGQAVGRLGCFFGGCCYGRETAVPWAIRSHGAWRHPLPFYEAGVCLLIAAILWWRREKARPAGWLFRYYLIAYAAARIVLEPLRGDVVLGPWPLMPAQIFCLAAIVVLLFSLRAGREAAPEVSELERERV